MFVKIGPSILQLRKEIIKTKVTYQDAPVKSFRLRRHGSLEKGCLSRPTTSVENKEYITATRYGNIFANTRSVEDNLEIGIFHDCDRKRNSRD